ncbi:MAG: polyprenyl synthetase family protein [Dehalococcoidia bacterium]
MQLSTIYLPIQEDLAKVADILRALQRPEDLPWMAEPLEYTLKDGGKRIRPALTLLAGQFHHYDLELLLPMATAVELFHTATLVHDDIVDDSSVRRGKPTINHLQGKGVAVLLGDYLFATSADLVASTGNLVVMRLYAQTLITISGGELGRNFSNSDPSEIRQDYYRWIGSKTACLFSFATQSGAILSQAPPEAVEALKGYGYNLGLSFQIVDDILDVVGEEEEMGKPVGADLLQGAITLPLILLLEQHPEGGSLRQALENRIDKEKVRRAQEMITNPAIIEECYTIAQGFRSRALECLEPLSHNRAHRALVDLADYVMERKK